MTNFLRVTKRKSGLKERGIPRRTRCDHFVRAHPALPAARRQTAAPITRLDHSCASFTRSLARRRTRTRPLGRSQTKLVRFSSEVGRANMDTNRLAKELREIAADTKSGVTVTVLGDNLAHMQGTLQGASRNGAHTQNDSRAKQIAPTARPTRDAAFFLSVSPGTSFSRLRATRRTAVSSPV